MNIRARIQASLFKRARSFARQREVHKLSQALGLEPTCERDFETLQTVASIKVHLHGPVRTIIDVGAHVGAFVEPAMRALGADEALCIEPQLPLHERLHSRLAGLEHQIIGCALADAPSAGTLKVHADQAMSSLLDSDPSILATEFNTYDHQVIEAVPVRISTLDKELACLRLPEPFLIKLDTQGTELQILRGAEQTLQRTAAILVEFMFTTPYRGGSSFVELVTFMDGLGFACAAATEIKRRASNHVSGVDFLFCRNGNHPVYRQA